MPISQERQAGAQNDVEITPAMIEAVTDIIMGHFWGDAREIQMTGSDAGFNMHEEEARNLAAKICLALNVC